MPDMRTVNARSYQEAIRLIGGEPLLVAIEALAEAMNRCELIAFDEGFQTAAKMDADRASDAYDDGFTDGFEQGLFSSEIDEAVERVNAEDDEAEANENAHVEGVQFIDPVSRDFVEPFKGIVQGREEKAVATAVASLEDPGHSHALVVQEQAAAQEPQAAPF